MFNQHLPLTNDALTNSSVMHSDRTCIMTIVAAFMKRCFLNLVKRNKKNILRSRRTQIIIGCERNQIGSEPVIQKIATN